MMSETNNHNAADEDVESNEILAPPDSSRRSAANAAVQVPPNRERIIPKCVCAWRQCRNYQRVFHEAKHPVLDGVIKLKFQKDHPASQALKESIDRVLKVSPEKSQNWKPGRREGQFVIRYYVARHHYTEKHIQKFLTEVAENKNFSFLKPFSVHGAKRYLYSVDPNETFKLPNADSQSEALYLQCPNVPRLVVKAEAERLRRRNRRNLPRPNRRNLPRPSRPRFALFHQTTAVIQEIAQRWVSMPEEEMEPFINVAQTMRMARDLQDMSIDIKSAAASPSVMTPISYDFPVPQGSVELPQSTTQGIPLADNSSLHIIGIRAYLFNSNQPSVLQYGESPNDWCVSKVTDMSKLFFKADQFDQPLDAWDVSKVTSMISMFEKATTCSQPLDTWDVSSVTDMSQSHMFDVATRFNQPLAAWDVSNVTNMWYLFYHSKAFNQNLDAWDVSNVKAMIVMFAFATQFNGHVNEWDVGQVTTMRRMFWVANQFNEPVEAWDVSGVQNMYQMFSKAVEFNQPLSAWNVSRVEFASKMFASATNFNHPLNGWDVSDFFFMERMFFNATSFNQNLCGWKDKIQGFAKNAEWFSVDNVMYMFRQTSCPNENSPRHDPNTTEPGPFCHHCKK